MTLATSMNHVTWHVSLSPKWIALWYWALWGLRYQNDSKTEQMTQRFLTNTRLIYQEESQ
jgi:hypothetical protein